MNYSIFSMLSKIGIFKVVVVASSLISLSSKTTGLLSPLRHHRAFRRCSVIVTVTPLIAFALAPSITCPRCAVRRCRADAKYRRHHNVTLPPPLQLPQPLPHHGPGRARGVAMAAVVERDRVEPVGQRVGDRDVAPTVEAGCVAEQQGGPRAAEVVDCELDAVARRHA